MVKAIFACILLVHALIHLMGFVKAFKLADIPQLTLPISKPMGILWLLTAILFAIAVLLLFFQNNIWWMVAIPAVILSQTLIFGTWQDAKFGTIANIIAITGIVLAFANWNFATMVQRELNTFLPKEQIEPEIVTRAMIADLPSVVQNWLERSNITGKPLTQTVHLQQEGVMRTSPEGNWMPVSAEQYFTIHPPGFIWIADVKMLPFLHFTGRDLYKDGQGHMLIKVLSLIPVADARGTETDQGTLLRYLAEICWFPSAALSNYIAWEQLDSTSAKATMTYGTVTASGIFTFSKQGDMISFEADRYFDRKEGATLERWHIGTVETSELGGFRIPTKSQVTWKLEDGDYTWFKLEITDIKYNENFESI